MRLWVVIVVLALLSTTAYAQTTVTLGVAVSGPFGLQQFPTLEAAERAVAIQVPVASILCGCRAAFTFGTGVNIQTTDTTVSTFELVYEYPHPESGRLVKTLDYIKRSGDLTTAPLWLGKIRPTVQVTPLSPGRPVTAQ